MEIVFIVIAILWILYCVFPGWNFSAPVLTVPVLIHIVIGLLVLYIIYLLIGLLLFGVRPTWWA